MKIPVILSASSGSQVARLTYQTLEQHIRNSLQRDHNNHYELHWGYSNRVVKQEHQKYGSSSLPGIKDIARLLTEKGHRCAILQSLHLLVGHEFHTLLHESNHISGLRCHLGKPLLTAPADFKEFMQLLTELSSPYPEHAVLLIGHGTRHASWPIYLGLEQIMQQHFAKRAYVGVVEHFPDTRNIEQRIIRDGHTKVLVIPFFLIAGLHLQRDVLGETESAWIKRLLGAGLEVDIACEQGLGSLPAIGHLYARHILDASNNIP